MSKLHTLCTAIALIAASSLAAGHMPAQTLARPGWAGSGLTTQPWFKHAILYEIDTRNFSDSNGDGVGDLKGITERLEYIHALGVDAILLRPLTLQLSGAQPTTIDPSLGSLDDFDQLTLEASRMKIRVLLKMPSPDAAIARFWLTRGVAGFYIPGSHLTGNVGANDAAIQAIRKLLPTYLGQRVLILDAGSGAGPTSASGTTRPASNSQNELLLDRLHLPPATGTASEVRAALEHTQTLLRAGTPIIAVDDGTGAESHLQNSIAAAILLNRSAALISAGQELGLSSGTNKGALMPWGQPVPPAEAEEEAVKPPPPVATVPDKYEAYVPYVRPVAPKKPAPPDPKSAAGQDINKDSLLNFYRELGRLHHGNTALRDGEEITLNHDDRNALIWLRKPASPTQFNPPILVACNLSVRPVTLSLKTEIAHLQLRGTFLKTMLRSDDLTGAPSIDPITLPPYGVYVGELRY